MIFHAFGHQGFFAVVAGDDFDSKALYKRVAGVVAVFTASKLASHNIVELRCLLITFIKYPYES